MNVIALLQMILVILVFIIFCLIAGYFLVTYLNKKNKEEEENQSIKDSNSDGSPEPFKGEFPRESIYKFMEFDEIKDNMIIRKNRTQYIMIIQCQGINYDLMSEEEKTAVEEGFVQFLNTLRFPIQLYIQTRSLNLKDIIDEYKQKVADIANDIEKINTRIASVTTKGNEKLKEKLEFEKIRKQRVLEYGTDIADYVARMSLNKNVLQQKTYIIISYYSSEFSGAGECTQEELDNISFSELYTRCQSAIRSLQSSEVTGKILNSEEISELLYVAYNRDDSELIQFSKALDAQYDALYSTGKDVLEKKQEKLQEAIDAEAVELATESIIKADKYRQIEKLKRSQMVKERANQLIDEFKDQMEDVIYEGAKKEIEKANLEDEEEKVNEKEKTNNKKSTKKSSNKTNDKEG